MALISGGNQWAQRWITVEVCRLLLGGSGDDAERERISAWQADSHHSQDGGGGRTGAAAGRAEQPRSVTFLRDRGGETF